MSKEITIYEKTNENGVLYLYCEDCKPRGGKKGTLVVSGYDSYCAGCGKDFYEMAQDTTPEPEQPYNPAMGDEVIVNNGMYSGLQGTVAGQVYIDRTDKQETVIVTLPKRGQIAYNVKDLVPAPKRLAVNDLVTLDLYGERTGKVVAVHDPGDGYGQSVEIELDEAWRGGKKFWFEAKDVEVVPPEPTDDDELSPKDITAIEEAMAQPDLTYTVEELQHAWDALQDVPAYTDRFQCYHDALSAFAQGVAIAGYMQTDAFELDGPLDVIVWEEAGKRLEQWMEGQPSGVGV